MIHNSFSHKIIVGEIFYCTLCRMQVEQWRRLQLVSFHSVVEILLKATFLLR